MSDSERDPENSSKIDDPLNTDNVDYQSHTEGSVDESDERLRRQLDRAKKNETRLLAVQMFTSMCAQITTQTDKNNDFLDSLCDSIDKKSHNISLSDIETYLTEVDVCVNGVSAIYKELLEINFGKPDSTQEKTFQEFLGSIKTFKAKERKSLMQNFKVQCRLV